VFFDFVNDSDRRVIQSVCCVHCACYIQLTLCLYFVLKFINMMMTVMMMCDVKLAVFGILTVNSTERSHVSAEFC